jgi:hypothetical protein
MTNRPRNAFATAALVLGWTATSVAQPPAPAASPATVTATVRAVAKEARELELVTGVGYALRTVKLRLPETAEVRTATGLAARDQLKAGDVVRVEYVKRADGDTVTKVTIVRPSESGGGR